MTPKNDREFIQRAHDRIFDGKLKDASDDRQEEELNELFKHSPASKVQVDTQAAWQKVLSKISVPANEESKSSPIKWYVAAAVSLLILASSALLFFLNDVDQQPIAYATENALQEISLPDGSVVTLNKFSSLNLSSNFNAENRQVTLNGEAFFSVKKSESTPFTIQTKNGNITVLGTIFNVKSASTTQGETSVYVQSGKVSLSDPVNKKSIQVIPGEIARVSSTGELSKTTVQNENMLYWKTRKLSFKSRRLAEVVSTVSNYLDLEINLSDELANCIVTFTFEGSTVEKFEKDLRRIKEVSFQTTGESYLITGEKCD